MALVGDLLGGQLAFSPVVVHSIVCDGSELPAAVVFIVDVVRHVLQVLHVSSEDAELKHFFKKKKRGIPSEFVLLCKSYYIRGSSQMFFDPICKAFSGENSKL